MAVTPASLPEGYYNAALDLLDRNLTEGRANNLAVIDDHGRYTYGEVTARANRFANALTSLGVEREQRVLLCLMDSVDFPAAFLGAIKAGVIPVCVNTLLTSHDYDFMLKDTSAKVLVVSAELLPSFTPVLDKHNAALKHVVVSGGDAGGHLALDGLLAEADENHEPARTVADDIAFWLYSSGSTGKPKGAVHLQAHLMRTADAFAKPILGIRESDVVFSAAKLFFAYGLGNNLTFPFSVGATAVLMAARPTPEACFKRLRDHKATIFYGVPTLFGLMLANPEMPGPGALNIRICTSAGEALPADLYRRWKDATGVEVLDGIGSTEMLHVFITNRPDDVRPGSSGTPVPGYRARLIGDDGNEVGPGEIGELQINGPTCCIMYWRQREKSRQTFLGPWTRTGDKYMVSENGTYTYCGRTDDMMKVSGQYVSPFEVEAALITHDAVLEAAVVSQKDDEHLVKPKAFIVLAPGASPDGMADALKSHVQSQIAPYKYPRWFEFVDTLPKTATGKIQRFKLRAMTDDA